MKKVLLVLVFFVGMYGYAYTQTPNLKGTWVLDNVILEKTDASGEKTLAPYVSSVDLDSICGIFQRIEFIDNTQCKVHSKNSVKTGTYKIEFGELVLIPDNNEYRYLQYLNSTKILLTNKVRSFPNPDPNAVEYNVSTYYKKL